MQFCFMRKLTPREYGIFSFVRQYLQDHQKSPTRREIGQAFKLTPQGADYHIQHLNKKGFIKLVKGTRNIRLLKKHYRRQRPLFTNQY